MMRRRRRRFPGRTLIGPRTTKLQRDGDVRRQPSIMGNKLCKPPKEMHDPKTVPSCLSCKRDLRSGRPRSAEPSVCSGLEVRGHRSLNVSAVGSHVNANSGLYRVDSILGLVSSQQNFFLNTIKKQTKIFFSLFWKLKGFSRCFFFYYSLLY